MTAALILSIDLALHDLCQAKDIKIRSLAEQAHHDLHELAVLITTPMQSSCDHR